MPVTQTTNTTVAQAALIIKAQLETFAAPRNAYVKILANTAHVWEELNDSNDRARILIIFTGEEARGSYELRGTWHRVERNWQVIVVRGHGWKSVLAEGKGDAEAFYDVLEGVRDCLRILLNVGQEWPPMKYIGMEPMPNIAQGGSSANVFMDSISLRFTTTNDILPVTKQVQQNPT